MLMEQLFDRGIMAMVPSKDDPARQVGGFNPEFLSKLPALRSAELEKFRWIVGEWKAENRVSATRANPAYTDLNSATFKLCEKDAWICVVGRDGRERLHITFDPFSKQWMYVLVEGAYGVLRSPGWSGNRIVFTGPMMMIGVDCELRQSWTKTSDDEFAFVNEEKLGDGSWGYVDEWAFRRK
jgi:hypothetical protein